MEEGQFQIKAAFLLQKATIRLYLFTFVLGNVLSFRSVTLLHRILQHGLTYFNVETLIHLSTFLSKWKYLFPSSSGSRKQEQMFTGMSKPQQTKMHFYCILWNPNFIKTTLYPNVAEQRAAIYNMKIRKRVWWVTLVVNACCLRCVSTLHTRYYRG